MSYTPKLLDQVLFWRCREWQRFRKHWLKRLEALKPCSHCVWQSFHGARRSRSPRSCRSCRSFVVLPKCQSERKGWREDPLKARNGCKCYRVHIYKLHIYCKTLQEMWELTCSRPVGHQQRKETKVFPFAWGARPCLCGRRRASATPSTFVRRWAALGGIAMKFNEVQDYSRRCC